MGRHEAIGCIPLQVLSKHSTRRGRIRHASCRLYDLVAIDVVYLKIETVRFDDVAWISELSHLDLSLDNICSIIDACSVDFYQISTGIQGEVSQSVGAKHTADHHSCQIGPDEERLWHEYVYLAPLVQRQRQVNFDSEGRECIYRGAGYFQGYGAAKVGDFCRL